MKSLQIEDLHLNIDGTEVLKGVDLSISRGEMLAFAGASGSGKSMTALAVMQLLPPMATVSSGSITFEGAELLGCSAEDMRQRRGGEIGMIFQEPLTAMNPVMKIGDQILEPILLHLGKTKSEAKTIALDLLADVHIADPERVFHSYPHQLSGGMRQRAMIAMALSCNPTLLLADEPTTALDVTVQARVLEIIKEQQHKRNLAILFITHDISLAANVAERIAVLHEGQVVETGHADQIISNPQHPYTRQLIKQARQRESWMVTSS
jgi:ABC-type dipeptide/oligopeptide/nickel transport system ATPase component